MSPTGWRSTRPGLPLRATGPSMPSSAPSAGQSEKVGSTAPRSPTLRPQPPPAVRPLSRPICGHTSLVPPPTKSSAICSPSCGRPGPVLKRSATPRPATSTNNTPGSYFRPRRRRERGLDFPTNGGHPVKGVQSPWEVQQWRERGAPTPPSSRPRPLSSSPSKATPSPRRPAPSASARTSSATGSTPSKPRASTPSPAAATSPPSRRRTAASGPRTSGSWRSATS